MPELVFQYLPNCDRDQAFRDSLSALADYLGLDVDLGMESEVGLVLPEFRKAGAWGDDTPWGSITLRFSEEVDPFWAFIKGTEALADYLGVDFSFGMDAEIAKAVPVHHSQFQERTSDGRFAPAATHHSAHQIRDAAGRFARRLTREETLAAGAEAGELVEDLRGRLMQHFEYYRAGRISMEEWAANCERDLSLFYRLIYRTGKQSVGDPAIILSPQEKAQINRLVRDEMDYLRDFGADMEAGRGTMPYVQRMGLYAAAAWEAYWNGFVLGDQRKGRELQWRWGETEEHCSDCAGFADMEWMGVREFAKLTVKQGKTPRSGALECIGINCKCWIAERLDGIEQPRVNLPNY